MSDSKRGVLAEDVDRARAQKTIDLFDCSDVWTKVFEDTMKYYFPVLGKKGERNTGMMKVAMTLAALSDIRILQGGKRILFQLGGGTRYGGGDYSFLVDTDYKGVDCFDAIVIFDEEGTKYTFYDLDHENSDSGNLHCYQRTAEITWGKLGGWSSPGVLKALCKAMGETREIRIDERSNPLDEVFAHETMLKQLCCESVIYLENGKISRPRIETSFYKVDYRPGVFVPRWKNGEICKFVVHQTSIPRKMLPSQTASGKCTNRPRDGKDEMREQPLKETRGMRMKVVVD